MGGDSDRGRDQARGRVLSVEDDGIDAAVVVVEALAHISLGMVHGSDGESLSAKTEMCFARWLSRMGLRLWRQGLQKGGEGEARTRTSDPARGGARVQSRVEWGGMDGMDGWQ